jgi:hypothetical protein
LPWGHAASRNRVPRDLLALQDQRAPQALQDRLVLKVARGPKGPQALRERRVPRVKSGLPDLRVPSGLRARRAWLVHKVRLVRLESADRKVLPARRDLPDRKAPQVQSARPDRQHQAQRRRHRLKRPHSVWSLATAP